MAVGVSEAHREVAKRAPHSGLHRMIDGVCLIFQTGDITEPNQGPRRIGIIAAGNAEISFSLRAVWRPVGKCASTKRIAIVGSDWLAGGEWIVRSCHGEKLIKVPLLRQMRTF